MLQLQNKIQTLLNKKVRKYKHHNKKKRNSIKHHKILDIEDIVSTNLEDCSGTTRVHNLFDKSVVPDVGSNGRQEAMVGRTCNTQNTPREIPNPVSLTRNPSSWSSPCIVHTWLQRSARSRSDNRVLIRGWNKNELKVSHTRRMTDIPRDSFFQLLASRTCRLWCDRNRRRSFPKGLIPFSLILMALKSAIELFV